MAIILYDSREKENKHILKAFNKAGIELKRIKLNVGDYSFIWKDKSFESRIVVERKHCIDEIIMNITKGKARFKREFERAIKNKTKVILMIEDTKENLENHKYRSMMKPSDFTKALNSWKYKYQFDVHWVEKDKAADFILEQFKEFCRKERGL